MSQFNSKTFMTVATITITFLVITYIVKTIIVDKIIDKEGFLPMSSFSIFNSESTNDSSPMSRGICMGGTQFNASKAVSKCQDNVQSNKDPTIAFACQYLMCE